MASRPLSVALLLAVAATVAVVATHLAAGSGTTQAPQVPAAPTFRTEANYVRVDVFPTANGTPVTDLTQKDFEVLDNGVPQVIEQFEHVTIRAAGPQAVRIEPNNLRESRAMIEENSRARVFVLFLDPAHVEPEASARIRKPLIEALDRFLGADDFIGVMTPEMSARDVTFARKTTTIETMLTRYWYWGERDRLNTTDPVEQDYRQCYPDVGMCAAPGVADEMIDRRREKRALDALEDLVVFLRGVREERKAVLAITDGWLLFPPNPGLARNVPCHAQDAVPQVGRDPRTGRLGTNADPRRANGSSGSDCEQDRIRLAQIDDEQQFRQILDEANRSNTSFYPVDPRGLVVFDTPIKRPGSQAPTPSSSTDGNMLRSRLTSLRRLAEGTDGLAIVSSNDLSAGLARVVADLTSYYLVGYYASGKLDGKFHSITVRIKRPGVQVRARRGYLAASEADVRATARAGVNGSPTASPGVAASAETAAIERALTPLEGYTRPTPVRVQVVAGWKPGNGAGIWAVGELATGEEWKLGAEADLMLVSSAGSTVATIRTVVAAGQRSFRVAFAPDQRLAPGDYVVRARVKSAGAQVSNELVRIALPESPNATGAVFMRRGPATANKDVPTADLRFRRNEQIRIEVPGPSATASARLLDRTGKPLALPLSATTRDEEDGSRWQLVTLSLAPLAAGDYVIEISSQSDGAQDRTLHAFRVVP